MMTVKTDIPQVSRLKTNMNTILNDNSYWRVAENSYRDIVSSKNNPETRNKKKSSGNTIGIFIIYYSETEGSSRGTW